MTTPVVLQGNSLALGTAIDNTGTDVFSVFNANNIVVEGGGNLQVFGNPLGNLLAPPTLGADTTTTVSLKSANGVKDAISLDNSKNVIQSAASSTLSNATVSIILDPVVPGYPGINNGVGGNTVNLSATTSMISITDSATSPTGGNSATVANVGGSTYVSLTGAGDTVKLTGDTANTVVTGVNTGGTGGGANISLGTFDDDAFDNTSSVTVAGSNNTVTGGDANTGVGGGANGNTINIGDGTDVVSLTGTGNAATVGGGNDNISFGGGSGKVTIVGIDGASLPAFADPDGEPFDDGDIPSSPTDVVSLSGMNNSVFATYENVNVSGSTGSSTVNLGNGNDTVQMGGNGNAATVGNGTNAITLSGNNNSVTVVDTAGVGFDTIALGSGNGDSIDFGDAGGSVIGTGTGTTKVRQDGANTAGTTLYINLNNGIGDIVVGDGSNIIKANGNKSTIKVGDGANNITATGKSDSITGGNGNDTVTTGGGTSGAHTVVTLGNGNDLVKTGDWASVTAGNGNDNVSVGANSTVLLGDGNDTVNLGSGSTATLGHAGVVSNEVVTGSGNGITVNAPGDGNDKVTLSGNGETVNLGNGMDTVSVTGSATVTTGDGYHDKVSVGSGSVTEGNGWYDTVNVAGNGTVTVGNGNSDSVTVGGSGVVTVGDGNKDTVNVGAGSSVTVGSGTMDSVTTGAGSAVSIDLAGVPTANDTVSVGASSTVSAGGGVQTISGSSGDMFSLNSLSFPSDVFLTGSANFVAIGSNSSVKVDLNAAQTSNTVEVQSLTSGGSYTGNVEVTNFNSNAMMDLQSLKGADGTLLNSFLNIADNMTTSGGNEVLALQGGGSIKFDGAPPLTAAQFVWTTNTGPV